MRRISLRSLAVLAVAALGLGAPAPVHAQPAPYEINVLLPLTGPAAFLGKEEQQSFQIAEKLINANGGIKGRPVRFVVTDDQSNPQVALQLAKEIIGKNVPVILGSPFAASCQSVGPVVAKSGPVDYCLAPIAHAPPRSFEFVAGTSSFDQAEVTLRYLREHGYTRIALITSTDATGQDMDAAFAQAFGLAENKSLRLVAQEHFAAPDISVTAQMARIKAANPQAVVTWTIGSPFGTVLRGIREVGLDNVPIVAANGNMLFTEMSQFAQLVPKELIFPAYRPQAPRSTASGPVKAAQDRFFRAFQDAGVRPDVAHVSNWDAIFIVVDALRQLGTNATADQLHAYIENLHGWAGINGIYDFRDGNQRGIGQNVLIMARWARARTEFLAISKTGGRLH